MGANSFWALFSRDTLPSCPFCIGEHEMEESRQVLGAWFCTDCQTTFKLVKDELEPVYEFDPQAELVKRRICQTPSGYEDPMDSATSSPGVGGLCRSCQHNQTIIIQLLSNFDPPESSGSFEQLASQYRRDLERRYPLCQSCKYFVDQKINTLSLRLKTKKLGSGRAMGSSARISQLEQLTKEIAPTNSRLFTLFNLLIDAAAVLYLRYEIPASILNVKLVLESKLTNPLVLRLMQRILNEKQLPSIIAAFAIFGAVKNLQSGILSSLLYLMLSGLRFALYCKKIMDPQMNLSASILIILIDLSLLMGRASPKRKVKPKVIPEKEQVVHPGRLPMNTMQPVGLRDPIRKAPKEAQQPIPSPSKTIVNDLMDIDWGIGSSAPTVNYAPGSKTVFGAPFSASLPGSTERRSVFAPSKLDPTKTISSMLSTPTRANGGLKSSSSSFSLMTRLRPAVLPVEEQPSGLENVLQGISFAEASSAPRSLAIPTIPTIPKLGPFGEIVITVVLLSLRIMIRDRPILNALILAASFTIHGPVWSLLPQEWQYGCYAMAAARFACIAAQLSEPDFAELMIGSLLLRLACLFLDLTILIAR